MKKFLLLAAIVALSSTSAFAADDVVGLLKPVVKGTGGVVKHVAVDTYAVGKTVTVDAYGTGKYLVVGGVKGTTIVVKQIGHAIKK